MILILIRHGNTFASGDKVIWVGKNEDLPLVPRGREQGAELASALAPLKSQISSITTGPLLRAKETGEIISKDMKLSHLALRSDDRLDEIDYGEWGGKTTEELLASGFQSELERWNSDGIYPENAFWGVSEGELIERASSFMSELSSKNENTIHIAVSSNGILRYFLRELPTAFESHAAAGSLKVRTGALSVFHYSEDNGWSEIMWNVLPADFNAEQVSRLL